MPKVYIFDSVLNPFIVFLKFFKRDIKCALKMAMSLSLKVCLRGYYGIEFDALFWISPHPTTRMVQMTIKKWYA